MFIMLTRATEIFKKKLAIEGMIEKDKSERIEKNKTGGIIKIAAKFKIRDPKGR